MNIKLTKSSKNKNARRIIYFKLLVITWEDPPLSSLVNYQNCLYYFHCQRRLHAPTFSPVLDLMSPIAMQVWKLVHLGIVSYWSKIINNM